MKIASYNFLNKTNWFFGIMLTFLLISPHKKAQCQNEKVKLPKGRFVIEDIPTSDMFHFKNNKLTVKTLPFHHYGFQYTHFYKIEFIDDSTFVLIPKKTFMKFRGVKARDRAFTLSTDTYTMWRFTNSDENHYLLYGFQPVYESIKQKAIKLKLVRTNDKYKQGIGW